MRISTGLYCMYIPVSLSRPAFFFRSRQIIVLYIPSSHLTILALTIPPVKYLFMHHLKVTRATLWAGCFYCIVVEQRASDRQSSVGDTCRELLVPTEATEAFPGTSMNTSDAWTPLATRGEIRSAIDSAPEGGCTVTQY